MKLARITDKRFRDVLKKLSEQKLPLKAAFKLKGIAKKVNDEFTKYDELRLESVKKFAEKDDAGNLILDDKGNAKFSNDGMLDFVKQLDELLSIDIEILPLSIDELGSELNITADELMILEDVIV